MYQCYDTRKTSTPLRAIYVSLRVLCASVLSKLRIEIASSANRTARTKRGCKRLAISSSCCKTRYQHTPQKRAQCCMPLTSSSLFLFLSLSPCLCLCPSVCSRARCRHLSHLTETTPCRASPCRLACPSSSPSTL